MKIQCLSDFPGFKKGSFYEVYPVLIKNDGSVRLYAIDNKGNSHLILEKEEEWGIDAVKKEVFNFPFEPIRKDGKKKIEEMLIDEMKSSNNTDPEFWESFKTLISNSFPHAISSEREFVIERVQEGSFSIFYQFRDENYHGMNCIRRIAWGDFRKKRIFFFWLLEIEVLKRHLQKLGFECLMHNGKKLE